MPVANAVAAALVFTAWVIGMAHGAYLLARRYEFVPKRE